MPKTANCPSTPTQRSRSNKASQPKKSQECPATLRRKLRHLHAEAFRLRELSSEIEADEDEPVRYKQYLEVEIQAQRADKDLELLVDHIQRRPIRTWEDVGLSAEAARALTALTLDDGFAVIDEPMDRQQLALGRLLIAALAMAGCELTPLPIDVNGRLIQIADAA